MHGVPGGQSAGFIADPGPGMWVWYDTAAQAQTAALWRRIAQRYAGRSVIAGYDLINEPDAPVSKLLGLYHRIIGSIREVDPNHMVIVEGNSYARDFEGFTRQDDNLAFSLRSIRTPRIMQSRTGKKRACWKESTEASWRSVRALASASPTSRV